MMEEAVIQRLLADGGVSALVVNRVFPGALPQGAELPAVILNRISGGPIYSDDGEAGLQEARIQIDCWGSSWLEAKTVARAATASLSAFHGSVAGVVFQNVLLDTERDTREGGGNASEYRFRTILDFRVWTEL